MLKEDLEKKCINFGIDRCNKCPLNDFTYLCIIADNYKRTEFEFLLNDLQDEIDEIRELVKQGEKEKENEESDD